MPDGFEFTGYQRFSRPLVLNPEGSAKAFLMTDVDAAHSVGPTLVRQTTFEGASFSDLRQRNENQGQTTTPAEMNAYANYTRRCG